MPVVVHDLPAEQYHRSAGVSNSALKAFRRSPAHYRARHHKSTKALRFGSLLHMAALEPELLRASIAVEPKLDARTKEGKALRAKFAEDNAGKDIVSDSDHAMLVGISRSLEEHKASREILRGPALRESSAYSIHERTGLLTRSRFDMLPNGADFIFDLKSCEDAGREAFSKALSEYRYYVQAPFYLDNATRCGEPRKRFIFCAVEKEEPFAVALWEVDQDSIEQGRDEYEAQLSLFAECVEYDSWPAYSSKIETISLPKYKLKIKTLN